MTNRTHHKGIDLFTGTFFEAGATPPKEALEAGEGRALAWTSDIEPHWCPEPVTPWDGSRRLWNQAVDWVTG